MRRNDGAIPAISQEKYPKRLVVFDTEAYRQPPVNGLEVQCLRLGVALYAELDHELGVINREVYTFTSGEGLAEFIEYKARKDRTLYVYAHNLRYDLQLSGLYTLLVGSGWISTLFVMESPPTFIKLKRGRTSLTLVDTFNYWQFSLKAMGEQLGLPKLEVDFNTSTTDDLLIYCKRDVEVLFNYLLNFFHFLQDNDLCGVGLTLASQAFRSFRHRFMTAEIILHNRMEVLKLERDAYFGGRCEAFFIGEKTGQTFYKLDVNSMYPYVMQAYTYPVEFIAYAENLPTSRLPRLLNEGYCIAECELNISTPYVAHVAGLKLTFPVGQFSGVLHHSELVNACKRGEVRQVKRIALYKRGDIFCAFVEFFYTLKLRAERSGDKITRHLAKIMLNSLYGKFGQRQVVTKLVDNLEGEKFARLTGYSESLGQSVEVNYLGNRIEVRYKQGESYYSSPVVAGAVTAYARSYLWELITLAGRENVYYCDTDSLIVNRRGYDNLTPRLHPDRLGGLKVEGVSNYLKIYSVKDYIFGDEVKVKGVPKNAVKLDANTWQYEQFRGAKTWIAEGMTAGVHIYTRRKSRIGSYDKGVVLPDGAVIPLSLGRGDIH